MIRLVPEVRRITRFYQGAWAAIFFVLFGISFWLTPSVNGHGTHTQLGLPPCPSVLMFNRPCPGCGMTTSFSHCAHLDFVGGFHVHPFGPILFVGWAITAVMAGYGAIRGYRLDTESRSFQWALACFAILFFIYGGIRFYQGFPKSSPDSYAIHAGLKS